MDAKEVKSTLKNAREAIRNKDFKEALKQCKAVLVHDKNNYNALVFVGVAAEGMEQLDQAVKAYKRAIETCPDQVLAWQGLCGFYEKHPSKEHDSDLVNVYQKLTEIHDSDKTKQTDILLKLARLDFKIGAPEMGVCIYQDIISSETDTAKKRQYKGELLEILCKEKSLSSDSQHELLVLELCGSLFESTDVCYDGPEAVVNIYLKLKLKHEKLDGILDTCTQLRKMFPKVVYPLEISIVVHLDRLAGKSLTGQCCAELEDAANMLEDIAQDSPYLLAARGVLCLCQKENKKAKEYLFSVTEKLSQVVCVHVFLAETYLALRMRSELERLCKTCSTLLQTKGRVLTVSSVVMTAKISIIQAKMDVTTGKHNLLERSAQALSELELTTEVRILLGYIYLKLGNLAKAESLVDGTADTAELDAWIHFEKGDYQAAKLRLSLVLEKDPDNSSFHIMMGKVLWATWKQDRSKETAEKCYLSLLKAAKLDPNYAEPFLYLGHFYLELQQDKMKAKKCYQKAFDLDNENEVAGAALCDVMTAVGQEEEACKILQKVTSKASAGGAKWAWLRLGLYQVQHETPSSAVTSFQSALRADPKDNHVWECLAEAYLHRGSLTAALKAFTKALELEPSSLYCLYQIAAIKQTLGVYSEAITEYKVILDRSPNYVPALKGIGETYLLQARSHLTQYFHGRVQDNCQDALMYLTRAAIHRPDLSCLWKLMGDACTLVHPLDKEIFNVTVDKKLMMISEDGQASGTCVINFLQTLQLGAKCYGKALKAIPDCSSLWHDLGVNFFHQSQHSVDQAEKKFLAEKSMNSLKKALSLDARNPLHWNALGRVYCSKALDYPDQAQHCFIKSIQVEANNVEAWTNLGTLYLKHNNIELAHESFKIAQSLEPSYVACWIGQALIAETVGDDDAMDLFRHTTELGNHIEGATGYAHWVCTMLQDTSRHNTELYRYSIQQMAAIPAASDALARYLDRVKNNASAYNMYGLLLEQQGLYRTSAKAFASALKLVPVEEEVHKRETRINYARVLCKLDHYTEAIEMYNMVGDLETLQDISNLAMCLYNSGQYKKSFKVYEKALELAASEEEKSHILTAQGMVMFKLSAAEAKTLLFKSSQMSVPSSQGLLALCALGILHSDMTLTLAVLQELFADQELFSHTCHLTVTANAVLENNWKTAMNCVQQNIHKYPDKAEMWHLLSSVLLKYCHGRRQSSAAASCAKSAQVLNPELNACEVVKLITCGQLAGGHHSQVDRNNNALKTSQKAVHLNPAQMENWCNLVSAVHGQVTVGGQQREPLQHIIVSLLQWIIETDATEKVKSWCRHHLIISLASSGQLKDALKILQQVDKVGDDTEKEKMSSLRKVLSGDKGVMSESLLKSRNDTLVLEALLESCHQDDVTLNLDDVYGDLDTHSDRRTEFMCRVLRGFYTYKQLLKTDFENEELYLTLSTAVRDILKLDSQCSLAHLMQGCINLSSNNRLAKFSLYRVMEKADRSNIGYDVSVARRCLLKLLCTDKKDRQALQAILDEAERDGDTATKDYYKELIAS